MSKEAGKDRHDMKVHDLLDEVVQYTKDTNSAVAELKCRLSREGVQNSFEAELANAVLDFAECHAEGYTNRARWSTNRLLWERVSDLVHARTGTRPPSPLGPCPEVVGSAAG